MPDHALAARRGRPKFPFFKDEHFGKITAATILRLLLISLMIFALIIGIGAWFLINDVEDNHTLAQHLQDVQTQNHNNRLADQSRTDAAIRDLACLAVRDIPSHKSDIVDQLRTKYSCPPYKKPGTTTGPASSSTSSPPNAGPPAGSPPAPSTPNGNSTQAQEGATNSSQGPVVRATSSPTGGRPTPPPSSHPPPPSSTPPPVPAPTPTSVLCTILKPVVGGILGLCP